MLLYICGGKDFRVSLSLSRFSQASDGLVSFYSEAMDYSKEHDVTKKSGKICISRNFSFSLESLSLNTIHQTRDFSYYFSPKLCPLFLLLSHHHQRERQRDRDRLSPARATAKRYFVVVFAPSARALPEKEVLSVCLFLSLLFCTKNRLNGHLKAVSSFPDLSLPHNVRGSSDRGRSSFMRESRGGDVRVRVSSGDV